MAGNNITLLVDDERIRRLADQIDALQEELATRFHADRETVDIYQRELLEASGKMLAFVRQSLGAQIFVMGDRGENPSQFNLSEANLFSQHPAFTPDGQYILYSQYKANAAIPSFLGMRIQDQGSTKEIRIPPSGASIGPVSNPTVSPDGFWIVFESWPDGKNHDIYRMLINGGDRAQLTSDPGFDFGPVWRPVTQNQ